MAKAKEQVEENDDAESTPKATVGGVIPPTVVSPADAPFAVAKRDHRGRIRVWDLADNKERWCEPVDAKEMVARGTAKLDPD